MSPVLVPAWMALWGGIAIGGTLALCLIALGLLAMTFMDGHRPATVDEREGR